MRQAWVMTCFLFWKKMMVPDSNMPVLLPGIDPAQVRYYSLARHALVGALRLCGVTKGSRVLLPSFLCRDVVAAVHTCGATPVWYDVSPALVPAYSASQWPDAEAVLAVNYFGFPQDLSPFQEYAERTKAKIIEDNAHGYGSRDGSGQWLGRRTQTGIFSIRKTLRIPDGAALTTDVTAAQFLPPQLSFSGAGMFPAQLWKSRIRAWPMIGEPVYRLLLTSIRSWRQWRGGGEAPADSLAESLIPAPAEPWKGLPQALSAYRLEPDAQRRRDAYLACEREAVKAGAQAVFECLPEGCAPYGFAFRGSAEAIKAMKILAKRQGWDCVTWPDLPDAIQPGAPDYYRNVHLINFLW